MKEFFGISPSAEFFYFKDAQTNIVALLDNTWAVVVKYRYDAWGKCQTTVVDSTATEIANLNPFRYRSYYLDTETGFYFLKTRYYDPEIGRFMTIDDISYLDPDSINGLNLYAYCRNNPVMGYDPNGTFAITTTIIIGLIAGAVIGGTVGGVVAYNNASASGASGWSLVGQTALGVLGGAVVGAAIGGLIGTGAWLAASAITAGIGAIGTGISALSGGATAMALATGGTAVSNGAVAIVGALGLAAILGLMFSKPNSGRIRFSDGTGFDPIYSISMAKVGQPSAKSDGKKEPRKSRVAPKDPGGSFHLYNSHNRQRDD